MTGPMQGSCIGAALFERWATNEAVARRLLESGVEVRFMPCHHVQAKCWPKWVESLLQNMPVSCGFENRLTGNRACCIFERGYRQSVTFWCLFPEVIDRFSWIKDVLGPTIAKHCS